MTQLLLLVLLVGAAAGFTAGLFGVGGGLVIVPTLYMLWRDDPVLGPQVMHFAVATSLACVVVTSVSSSWTHWRAGRLKLGPLGGLLAAVSVGSLVAVWVASWAATGWLRTGFGIFAALTCLSLLWQQSSDSRVQMPRPAELLGAGAFIGHVSTLLGVSGGAMTVPYLVLRGVDLRHAVVVSSALAMPISLVGAIGLGLIGPPTDQAWGYVHIWAVLGISASSVFFANWGARLSQHLDRRLLQKLFASFLALVAINMLAG
jgi:uncharacterized membrane protein YfcA